MHVDGLRCDEYAVVVEIVHVECEPAGMLRNESEIARLADGYGVGGGCFTTVILIAVVLNMEPYC